MRALILHGPGDLRLEDVPEPVAGPGEVVVRTECAMTCATDAKILRNGRHPALPAVPAPFGHELTGEVVEVGEGVGWPQPGMRVVVANSAPCGSCRPCSRARPSLCEALVYLWGTFAEYVRIPAPIVAANLLVRPDDLPVRLAPLIEPLACAIHAVSRSSAGLGDEVVVLGGGVQGQLLTACLSHRGARVVLCDPHEDRRRRARAFGADETFDAPRDLESIAHVRDGVAGGRGADVVFEAVGRPETWEAAVALAGRGAEVNLYGGCPMGTSVTLPTEPLHYAELRLQGSYHHTPEAVREALAMLRASDVPFAALIGEPIGLDEVAGVLGSSGPKRPVIP